MLLPDVPSAPSNVIVTIAGVNSLRVEWSSPIIEEMNVVFSLTVLNRNAKTSIIVTNIIARHHVFTAEEEDPSSCDVLTFQVVATNDFGSSPSEQVEKSLPSLPDVFQVEDLLQHSLVNTDDGLTLNITFNVSNVSNTVAHY